MRLLILFLAALPFLTKAHGAYCRLVWRGMAARILYDVVVAFQSHVGQLVQVE